MSFRRKLPWYAAALMASACLLPAVCGAQSLSLSYKLDPVNTAGNERVAPIADRCSGLTWASSLVSGCIVEQLRNPGSPQHEPAAYTGATGGESRRIVVATRITESTATPTVVEAPASYELPTLGSPAKDGRLLSVAGGREALPSAPKSVDLLFRFGSKYRMKNGDEGWESYKFVDVNQESRLPTNNVKNLGVELLFPFQ